MNKVSDERHLAYFDVFPLEIEEGQINVSRVYPRTVVGWHRHRRQDDYWFVAKGTLKVGTKFADSPTEFEILKEGESKYIGSSTWHGFMALEETILVYYCTKKYDGTDEERAEIGSFGESWEVVAK